MTSQRPPAPPKPHVWSALPHDHPTNPSHSALATRNRAHRHPRWPVRGAEPADDVAPAAEHAAASVPACPANGRGITKAKQLRVKRSTAHGSAGLTGTAAVSTANRKRSIGSAMPTTWPAPSKSSRSSFARSPRPSSNKKSPVVPGLKCKQQRVQWYVKTKQ